MNDERTVEIVRAMSAIVGADHVLADRDRRAGYETDWTGRYSGACTAVVRPGSTREVAAVLAACNDRGITVVTQGGNTGLVGGGVPRAPGTDGRSAIVLSTRRLDAIDDVDATAMQFTAGAGVTIAAWRDAANTVGLDAPVDFAARESATIGGAIATNAGGSRVVRYGTMRRQVVGIEAVLADGTVVGSLAGLPKETVGLHWPSVVAGSEGTLAVVTAARLTLVPRYRHVITALVSLRNLDDALALLGALRQGLDSLDSVELILPAAMALVTRHLGMSAPVALDRDGVALLVECADHTDPTARLAAVLAGATGILDSALATAYPQRQRLLALRDRITEATSVESTGIGQPTYKLDVAVPLRAIDTTIALARETAEAHGARVIIFGHLAEGNLHLNFLGAPDPSAIAEAVLPAVARCGGTISAEHGVGIAKTRWLSLVRRSGDLAAQRAIKRALDPNDILNPGVLRPTDPADAADPTDQVP